MSASTSNQMIRYLLLLLLGMVAQKSQAQLHTLSIAVKDSTQYAVANATIRINKLDYVVDSAGRFATHLPPGKYKLFLTAVGHTPASFLFTLRSDTTVRVILLPRESLLNNVIVTARSTVHRNQMSTQALNINQIEKLPVILGEVDPLKTITLLPGVKNGGEASAGLYVRGGGPDQNLVLLDGNPIYNPNHLLGFFSIFNGDAIRNIEVIKGGIPAEYGGRLSSVIAVDTREGDRDSLRVKGGIGLISSRLAVEGPIDKGKSSFLVSARRTYIDQIAKLVAKDSLGDNGYYFYDVNAKVNFQLNKNNALGISFYLGKDNFTFVDEDDDGPSRRFNALWGNTILGLTWKQQLGKQLRQEFSLVRNDFDLDSRMVYGATTYIYSSGLTDYGAKNDWVYSPGRWLKIKAGWQYTWHNFRPGAGNTTAGVQDFKNNIQDQYAHEAAAYLSTDLRITSGINLVAGLRYSYFNQVGPTAFVKYAPDGAPTGDKENYSDGQSIARYHYPEPRVAALFRLSPSSSIKLSYTRTVQYLHLATTSAATFPGDLWIPAGKNIQPALAEQAAASYSKDWSNGAWEMSIEAYYKTMSNQIEFKPGARLLLNQNLEGEMVFGKGMAYGVEWFLQKKTGRLTGWIGYTLSRTDRVFPDLNNGKPFPYRYDRTHDGSLVVNYKISRQWEVSGVFVYGTGNALTMPSGRFAYGVGYNRNERQPVFTSINHYDQINDYRMPAYHRLDIAFTYARKPRRVRRFSSSWNFGVYNVYNRYNPYFIYLDVEEATQTIQGKKVFLFPIVPSVTWNFKF